MGRLEAGVADHFEERLGAGTAQAEEHRPRRSVLAQVLQPDRDDRDLPVV